MTTDYTQDIEEALKGITEERQHYMRTVHGQHARTIQLYVVLDGDGLIANHDIPELLAYDVAQGYTIQLASEWRAAQNV